MELVEAIGPLKEAEERLRELQRRTGFAFVEQVEAGEARK
jgi:hypothetical protein